MIPNYPIKIWKRVSLKPITWPSEEDLTYEDGLLANHEYRDERGHDWDEFLRAYTTETKLINQADQESKTEREFERTLENLSEKLFEDCSEDLWSFELGVASVSLAISAMGCAPVSSCRHHPDRSNEPHPYVAFWTTKRDAMRIKKVIPGLQIGLANYEIEGYGGLISWARNIKDLMAFGNALYQNYGAAAGNNKK